MSSVYLAPMVLISLLFILIATRSLRKSFATSMNVITMTVFTNLFLIGQVEVGFWFVICCQTLLVLRQLSHKHNDTLVRG